MIVSSLRLVRTGRGDAAELSAALDSWTPVTWAGQLHPGDLGWQLRFEDELVDGSLLVARDGAGPRTTTGRGRGPLERIACAGHGR